MKRLRDISEKISKGDADFISLHKLLRVDHPQNPDGLPHVAKLDKDKSRSADYRDNEDAARYDNDPRYIDVQAEIARSSAEFVQKYGIRNHVVVEPEIEKRKVRESDTPAPETMSDEYKAARDQLSEQYQEVFDEMFANGDHDLIKQFIEKMIK